MTMTTSHTATTSNSAMMDAMTAALTKMKQPKKDAPVFHRPAAKPAPAKETAASKDDVPRDSILRMRYMANRRYVPMAGRDGIIRPTLGWMIDLLGLEYLEIPTDTGRHLVIMRNEHFLRNGEGVGELYHLYVPDGRTSALVSMDLRGGTVSEIRDEIVHRNEKFDWELMTDELDRAFAISDEMYLKAMASLDMMPELGRKCVAWHRQDICHGLNNYYA